MLNIIREQPTAESLAKIFAESPSIHLLPPENDPAWRAAASNPVAAHFIKPIREQALAEIDSPMPVLTDELYADYFKTGIRTNFELLWFERRRRVARAAIATLTEPEPTAREKFRQSLIAKLTTVLDEVSWTFPAHAPTEPTGKNPMMIDLFAAETCNLFAEMLDVFGDSLTALRPRIVARLKTQFFDNYLTGEFWWPKSPNNWNAVCHQGVLGAALAVSDDPALLGRLFSRAAQMLPTFLAGFGADGGSSEGPGYWGYGFGWYMELNRQLEARTKGKLSIVEGDPHVRAIAQFGPRMTLTNGNAVNFADGSHAAVPRPGLLQYLGERFDSAFIRSHAALGWQRATGKPFSVNGQRDDFLNFSRLLLRCPTTLGPPQKLPDGDLFMPDLAVAVSRFHDRAGNVWEFAAKAGHNEEHHNHNDLGSYLLNIDGKRMLIEIGAPEYVRDFFKKETRYTFIAARSLGHPVPLINRQEQPMGAEYKATSLQKDFDDKHVALTIDLTAGYAAEAGCRKCVREFEIDKPAGRLRVTDTFELAKADALETAIITDSPITLRDGFATITRDGVTLRITPDENTMIREVQKHPYRTHAPADGTVDRIVLVPKKLSTNAVIGYSIDLVAVASS